MKENMKTIYKDIPIYAGMKFTYPGTINNKIHIVGMKRVRFDYNIHGELIGEKEIKRTIL